MSDDQLSAGTLAYIEERGRNAYYDYIMGKFKEAEMSGLTKSKLARRLRKRPDHISKILGSPGNWTIGMITALLAGICNEELLPSSRAFIGRPPRNMTARDLLLANEWPSNMVGQAGNFSIDAPQKFAWNT